MTDVITLTAVDVSTAVYDDLLIDAVKGCLEGETDDYFFFQYDSDDYCLVISDDCAYDNGIFSASFGHVIRFHKRVVDRSYDHSVAISGQNSGQFAGPSNGGGYSGGFSGSFSQRVYNFETIYYLESFDASNVLVRNTDQYLTYGSFAGLPRLIEGVQNYAYFQVFLIVGIVLFKLCDRIFRRVY